MKKWKKTILSMWKIILKIWQVIVRSCHAVIDFGKRKNVIISAKRYGIDAMGAMAQGLFASLLIGTIIATLGERVQLQVLIDVGNFAKAVAGPAMAVSIGYALQAPQLVLFSLFYKL